MEGSMNANRLISMAINMIVRRVMRSGIDAGVNAFANRKAAQDPNAPQQRQNTGGPNTRDLQQRARRAIRLGRRFGRF